MTITVATDMTQSTRGSPVDGEERKKNKGNIRCVCACAHAQCCECGMDEKEEESRRLCGERRDGETRATCVVGGGCTYPSQ